jgi:hypothetical protein
MNQTQAAVLGGVLSVSCAEDGAGSDMPDIFCMHTNILLYTNFAKFLV